MTLPITLGYAGLLGILMAVLSIRVPMRRGAIDVPYGDGGDLVLATRIRAFGNFIEYAPMFVVLLALLEGASAAGLLLHGLGAGMVASRLLHAFAYLGAPTLTLPRKVGRGLAAMSTWLVLSIAAGACCWYAWFPVSGA